MAKGKELLRGWGMRSGQVTCTLRVIKGDAENGPAITPELKELKAGECLVAVKVVPAQNEYLELAAAIIENSGGKASHGSIYCSAKGKVSIYNTASAIQADGSTHQYGTEVLKTGQKVVVEGLVGEYEEDMGGGNMKRRMYGVIYEYVPDKPGATPPRAAGAKTSLADLMAKYSIKSR